MQLQPKTTHIYCARHSVKQEQMCPLLCLKMLHNDEYNNVERGLWIVFQIAIFINIISLHSF